MSVPSRIPPGRHQIQVRWSHKGKKLPTKVFTFDVENPDYGKPVVDADAEAFKKKFRAATVVVLQRGKPVKQWGGKEYAGCVDAKMTSTHRVSDRNHDWVNYGGTDSLSVGQYGQNQRTLIRFDLAKIPSHATIEAAFLKLRSDRAPGRGGKGRQQGKYAYKVLRPWGAGIGNGSRWDRKKGKVRAGECSWKTARHPEAWGAQGCDKPGVDREEKPLAASFWEGMQKDRRGNATPLVKVWVKWDITRAVREWVAKPKTNHGLLLAVKEGEGSDLSYADKVARKAVHYRSSDYFDPIFRPKLIVVYRR